ncbi:MAG: copper amine oxidase N-terminal domain-containing protein, partial [Caldiserica bacterium]|nr:copper amine oxidase N-terminal domain-containing protein [Caldisericota bacterium]
TFTAKPKKTIIVLTLEKKEWTVNGTAQTPLKAAPTSKFTDPKLKVLNGTTYMPIAQVAPLLNCTVAWDAKTKKVTLTQTLSNGKTKVLELWLNKTKGKIDGKEVTYNTKGTIFPTVIGGNTCLPFRWFAENLGAKVDFDAKAKIITLTYPQ